MAPIDPRNFDELDLNLAVVVFLVLIEGKK
jgi:hypothetical protein